MAKAKIDPQIIMTTLMACTQNILEKMFNFKLSKDPAFVEKNIIEYDSKMRVFGLEKFNGPCYVSAIHFYLSPKHLEKEDPLGAMVLFVKESVIEKFLVALGFHDIDRNNEESVLDSCGELANVIAGQFKNELVNYGYKDLTISAPIKEKNDISAGVLFHYDEQKYYELSFDLWKEKSLVLSITMALL